MNRYVFLILIILPVLLINCGKKEKTAEKKAGISKARFISAKSGLRMRDKPDISGEKITAVPYGEKVILLEESGKNITLSGATGKWSRVKWKKRTGWVFGGFLREGSSSKGLNKNIFIGKTLIFPEGGSSDEGMDADQVRLTLNENGTITGDCNAGGYGAGPITGEYKISTNSMGIIDININGEVSVATYTEKKNKSKQKFKESITIEKKNNKFIGTVKIPLCPSYTKKNIILSDEIPKNYIK